MKVGHVQIQPAKLHDRRKSTISQEVSCNLGLKDYRPKQACAIAAKRSEKCRNAATAPPWVAEQATCLLKLQWSPEQIAGKLPVSHETLYRHVYSDKAQGGTLWKSLRCQKQKRKRYSSERDRRGQIPHRRPLCDWPSHIEARKQVGHWEFDTIIGANHKGAIVKMVERNSGFSVIVKDSQKKSKLVSRAIIEGLRRYAAKVITLTYDNDKEFVGHIQFNQMLKSTGYFAGPFASWELGFNENFNGLLRQYAPKKRSMNTVDEDEITMIQNRSNNRPRKRLGFKLPSEMFHQSIKNVVLQT